MYHKGQAELIIIVALLAVIVIVVATQVGNIIPTTESPDVRNARESVEGLIQAAVLDTMETMSDRGGYLSTSEYQLGSVYLNDREVPYWQYGGQVSYPDAVANLRTGVQEYVEANKDSFEETLSGIILGNPLVGTPVFSNDKVTLTVNMPTTYKETQIAQPYTITMDTSFGDIYDFSRGLALHDANKRPFEYYTLSTMMLSPIENNHHEIPMYEILVGCGDYIFASSLDVIPSTENAIKKTLAHIYMPGKVPLGTLNTSTSPKYSLVRINNKDYENLGVGFMLPDDFTLDYSNFRMSPDPATGVAEAIPMLGDCVGEEPVIVDYNIRYPVVVVVDDPASGRPFQFALDVFIINNTPAEWSASMPDSQDDVCSNPNCILELDVKDSSGDPVEGANVNFMGCFLGRTGTSGYVGVLAPCGSGALYVYKRGYGDYIESRSSSELNGTVTLYKKPLINLIVHEAIVQDNGGGNYMVYYGDVLPIEDKKAYISFRSTQGFGDHSFYLKDPVLTISTMPVGSYYASGTLTSSDYQTLEGAFAYTYAVEEDLDGKSLHIYIPTITSLDSMTDDDERKQKILDLSEVLHRCGIGPVMDTAFNQQEACAVTL